MKYRVEQVVRQMYDGISYTADVQVMDEDRFADWCVAACGGGFTRGQTANAMAVQAQARDHGTAHLRDFLITRVDEG